MNTALLGLRINIKAQMSLRIVSVSSWMALLRIANRTVRGFDGRRHLGGSINSGRIRGSH
jgi:hypothetical protein